MPGDTHGLGYERVDGDPNVSVLLEAMDATAHWDAVRQLRAWERATLGLSPDQRLLDVGCGLGDAALALGADLGSTGSLVGVDASAEMIAGATARAGSAPCRTQFTIGDATALDHADDSFDAVRSERTLQWLPDPAAAVAEMVRVLRPGGRLALIDTDWSTFDIDAGDEGLRGAVRRAMGTERGRPSSVGRRLADLVVSAGLHVLARTSATQRWSAWDPAEVPAPAGLFSMASLADDLVTTGELDAADHDRFLETVHRSARERRLAISLTMFAVIATRPPPARSYTSSSRLPASARSLGGADRAAPQCHSPSSDSAA